MLQVIDCSQTSMNDKMIVYFKNQAPVFKAGLQTSFSPTTIIVESEMAISFEMFWKKYDHKFHKERSEKIWDRLSKTNKILAFYGLDKYHKYLHKNSTQAKMHPDTYLRSHAWLNDYK